MQLLEFQYQNKTYSTEVDGYKPLGVYDEEGETVSDDRIYEAAMVAVREHLVDAAEFARDCAENR